MRPAEPGREVAQDLDRLGLARLVRVRDVRIEAYGVEARRRHHLGDQPVGGYAGFECAEGQGAVSAMGLCPGTAVEDDTTLHLKRRARLHDMRRLFPVTDPTPADDEGEWSLDALADAYAYPEQDGPWLRANMVSTLDGAAQHDGRSQPISCESDMRIFGTLRGLADVVLMRRGDGTPGGLPSGQGP